MLGKLLKYDIKSTARYMIPLYILFILISIINSFLKPFEVLNSLDSYAFQIAISVFLLIAYFLMAFGIIIASFIILILRFQKNLLGDEGYLSFTLPVKTWQHIISKLINSVICILASLIVFLISLSIITWVDIVSFIKEFSILFESLGEIFGYGIYIILPIYMIIGLVLNILMIYNSITLGHQVQNHKIIASFAAYFVFYFITQAVLLLISLTFFLFTYGSFADIPADPDTLPNGALLLALISLALGLLAIGHYLSINYFMKNKLNLE